MKANFMGSSGTGLIDRVGFNVPLNTL